MKQLVIFDLDGTLINSIADLAVAVNQALEACNYPTHPEDAYRFMVGDGVSKLFERALPEAERTRENVERIRERFMPFTTPTSVAPMREFATSWRLCNRGA